MMPWRKQKIKIRVVRLDHANYERWSINIEDVVPTIIDVIADLSGISLWSEGPYEKETNNNSWREQKIKVGVCTYEGDERWSPHLEGTPYEIFKSLCDWSPLAIVLEEEITENQSLSEKVSEE